MPLPSRVPLLRGPTPLHPLSRLSEHLGGPRVWVKRDDLTGVGAGGNKARKLEYLLGQALAESADTVITGGALQSNMASQLAAAAARLGLRCELALVERVRVEAPSYASNGNMLLDPLFGATVHRLLGSVDLPAELERIAAGVRARGGRPFVIAFGGSNPVGAAGYLRAFDELMAQADEAKLSPTHIVVPAGSAGTQAGLVAGAVRSGRAVQVEGYSVGAIPELSALRTRIHGLAQETLALAGTATEIPEALVRVSDRSVGEGYGLPAPETLEAMRLVARFEGLVLDPVYTGKAFAGLLGDVREGRFRSNDEIVFIHTGGLPGVFAYAETVAASRGAA